MTESLHEVLFRASRWAHAARQHEAAYHALAAAMHAAVDAKDVARLHAVDAEALAQIGWIDEHDPAHRVSTASAATHGHPGLYAMLSRQTNAHLGVLERQAEHDRLAGETDMLLGPGEA